MHKFNFPSCDVHHVFFCERFYLRFVVRKTYLLYIEFVQISFAFNFFSFELQKNFCIFCQLFRSLEFLLEGHPKIQFKLLLPEKLTTSLVQSSIVKLQKRRRIGIVKGKELLVGTPLSCFLNHHHLTRGQKSSQFIESLDKVVWSSFLPILNPNPQPPKRQLTQTFPSFFFFCTNPHTLLHDSWLRMKICSLFTSIEIFLGCSLILAYCMIYEY